MGGRVAEELIFGTDHITTGWFLIVHLLQIYVYSFKDFQKYVYVLNLGASSDFDNATQIAKRMVTRFGMSEKVV